MKDDATFFFKYQDPLFMIVMHLCPSFCIFDNDCILGEGNGDMCNFYDGSQSCFVFTLYIF